MGIIEYLKKNVNNKNVNAPSEYCPNCWGRQEYSGNFYDAIKTEGIDTKNIESKKGWVLAYAEKYLTGIKLNQKDAKIICNSCQTTYSKTN